MPLKDPYGILKGTIVAKLDSDEAAAAFPKGKPHFQLKVDGGGDIFRVAINVKSDTNPPNLQVHKDDNYKHPMLAGLADLAAGFTPLASNAQSGALDFIRQNLFDMSRMMIMPASGDPSGNDMNDIFNLYVDQAMNTNGALVYAFGAEWHDGKEDPYFHFQDGRGVHEIHLNQGNVKPPPHSHEQDHSRDNGVYQDGALFIYYPDENRWAAVFSKFQSQVVHTQDDNAGPIVDSDGKPVTPETDTPVVIYAALVNPIGADPGLEQVYLLNTSSKSVSLDGWSILDKTNKAEAIRGTTLAAGDQIRIKLSGQGAQLSNKGGTISLLNKEGLKVSGVSYTADDARDEGRVIKF